MQYQIYKDNQNLWRWRFLAANHETIAVSSESYHNRDDCVHSIHIVQSSAHAPIYDMTQQR